MVPIESVSQQSAVAPSPDRPTAKRALFITGASGYIGRRLLEKLDRTHYARVVCLEHSRRNGTTDVEVVSGSLERPETYEVALSGCDTVIHLAAMTGKARPAEYFRVNRDGTRAILEAAKSRGVRNFLHVSTIAVKFADQKRYFYAHSKKQAETIVKQAGLAHTILRPTIVTGPEAPVAEGLARMAKAPRMPVFGDGRTRVQPIFIDDVVDAILGIVAEGRFRGETIELGGPEVLSIEELMSSIGRARFGKASKAVHIPLGPVRSSLGILEPILLPVLPLTAGQLALFANESTIAPSSFVDDRRHAMKNVEASLRADASAGELHRECRTYYAYLLGGEPCEDVVREYAAYHRRPDARAGRSTDRFDERLLELSRRSPFLARLVDTYVSLFHRRSVVRKKLVLLIAILECTPSTFEALDKPDRGPRPWILMKLGIRAAVYGLSAALATPPLTLLKLITKRDDGAP